MRKRLVTLLGLIAAASCGDPTAPAVRDLALTAAVSRSSFHVGDSLTVTVTVTNIGAAPEDINASLCNQYPFVIVSSTSAVVGPEKRDELCLLANANLVIVSLTPGKAYAFKATWFGGSNAGSAASPALLAPGDYFIRGALPGINARVSVPVTITVLP